MKKFIFLLLLTPLGLLAQNYRVPITGAGPKWDSAMDPLDSFVTYYKWEHPKGDTLFTAFLKTRSEVEKCMKNANYCLKHVTTEMADAKKSSANHDNYGAIQHTQAADHENKDMDGWIQKAAANQTIMMAQLKVIMTKDKAYQNAKSRKVQ